MKKTTKLRELFNKEGVVRIVGAHDGLGAKLVEGNGFDGIWASGLEISASYAVPDANILTMSQYLERACEMNDATNIPVIADCDTGYGNVNNVIYMVRKYEAAGIAGVCIEDKLFPKVNSYIPGRQELASVAEFVGKIMAAKNTQSDSDFMLIARVEALIAGWGLEEALRRAKDYADAGADAILIHSKASNPDEIRAFCKQWDGRVPLVVVPTTYPMLHIEEMETLGIKMVIYANQGMRASIKAVNSVLSEINKSGSLASIGDSISLMSEVFYLQGMRQFRESEKLFLKKGDKPVKVIIPAAGDPSYENTLRGVVNDCPIAMLDINGKSILQRNKETLNKAGISDITVITGYNAQRFDVEGINYVENKSFANTSQLDSIMMAKEKLDDNAVIAFSDIIFEKEIILRLLESSGDIVLVIDSAISQNSAVTDYVKADISPDNRRRKISAGKLNRILKLSKNMGPGQANFEFIGLSYFSKEGVTTLKKFYSKKQDKLRGDYSARVDFLDVIQDIIDSGVIVSGLEVSSGWIEIRNLENYKLAHSSF